MRVVGTLANAFNAYYGEEEAPDVDEDNYKLLIEGLVDDKRPWTLDRLYAATRGDADHPACLRRGLERDGKMDCITAARISPADRRRHAGKVCAFRLRRGLFQLHRYGDGATSADAVDLQVRRKNPAAEIWLSHALAHSDQARLQKSQACHRARCPQQLHRRLLGGSGLQLVQRSLRLEWAPEA